MDSDSIMNGLIIFDEETQEYKRDVIYRPVLYAPYPFVASRISFLAPPSDLAPYSANADTPGREECNAATFLDLDGTLRTWTQAAIEVSSFPTQEDEGSATVLSAAYTPASWLSEQDWFDGADAPTDSTDMPGTYRSEPAPSPAKRGNVDKGERSACPGAESGSLVEVGLSACPGAESACLAEGSRSVRPGTESAPLEERSEELENYEGGRSAPRGAESVSLVEVGRSTRPGVESAYLAKGSCSGFPGPESAPLEERRNKGGRGTRKRARSAALAEGSRRVRPGTRSAPLEERLQEMVLQEGGCSARRSAKSVSLVGVGRSARPGVESVCLAEGSCSGFPGPESAPLGERVIKGDRITRPGVESAYLAEGGRSAPSREESAYLEERIQVAERLEAAARDASLRGMRSLGITRTSSSISVGPRSILKRSRAEQEQPEPLAKRVRWCQSTDMPKATARGDKLYSPRPAQRWDQRLVHGVAKIKAAFTIKSRSSHGM